MCCSPCLTYPCSLWGCAQIRPLHKSNMINLLLSCSASTCEILLALFRWDKDQRPFEGSPASLNAFACASGGWCRSVNWYFLFPFLCLPRALRFCRGFCRACCCSLALLDTIPVSFFLSPLISYVEQLETVFWWITFRILVHLCSCQ